MKVIATQMGFYKVKRQREGSEFDIDPKDFSRTWMKEVKAQADEAQPTTEAGTDPEAGTEAAPDVPTAVVPRKSGGKKSTK